MPPAADRGIHHRLAGAHGKQLPDLPRENREMPTGYDLIVVVQGRKSRGWSHLRGDAHTPVADARTRFAG